MSKYLKYRHKSSPTILGLKEFDADNFEYEKTKSRIQKIKYGAK